MRKKFDLLVFDWDGTLMDSAGAIVSAIQASCCDLGLPVPSAERARHIIGLGLSAALSHLLPELKVENYERLIERYRQHYLSRDGEIRLFGGAGETIQALHDAGFLLAVATGKSRAGLERAFQSTGLGKYFHASRCADECNSKPHPGMLLELMQELGAGAGKTLMIGDTTHDLQMAISAGVPSLAVAFGAHPREGLLALSPLGCVDNFEELRQWLSLNA